MKEEAYILKTICANNGAMEYDELVENITLNRLNTYDFVFVDAILKNSEKFAIVLSNGEKRVIAKTGLRLCRAKFCDGCRNLHLCKLYLFGGCPFSRGRRPCRFSHELDSEHNSTVLRQHDLLDLDTKELFTLLLQNDNFFLPPVCFNYNQGDGQFGKCQDEESCGRLHICLRYLKGSCYCFRSHDFYEPQPRKSLQDKGVPQELFASLKSVYKNIEALRDHGRTYGNRDRTANSGASSWESPNRSKDKSELCLYYVRGSCKHGEKCWRVHSSTPYRWEVKEGSRWSVLPHNEAIERDYCDPANTSSDGVLGMGPIHFDLMTQGTKEVRRLSTASSVVQPTFVLTTQWLWYWEDEKGKWIRYSSSSDGYRSASITSEELEQRYLEDRTAVVEFSAGSQNYQLSLADMIQTNKLYFTKKLVRRRPVFVSKTDIQTIKTSKKAPNHQSSFKALPSHWNKVLTPETGFKRIVLQSSSVEYREILGLFSKTLRTFYINSIERIQNKALWEVFQWQKDCMKKSNPGGAVRERQLFHGTDSQYVDAICLNNFDWRICGTHGTAYGKGSYFARDAKYSHCYTSQSKVRSMFVCRVLVGDSTNGDPSYLRPPSKDGGDTIFYDSCVDNVRDPSIFVVFEKHQVYPEYLIQYQENANSNPLFQRYRPTPRPAPTPASTPAPLISFYPPPPPPPPPKSSSDSSCVIS